MSRKPVSKQVTKTPILAYAGFGLGILALIPMAIMTVDFIVPKAFASEVAKMLPTEQAAFIYYNMFGSLPFAIASLVTGILALRRITGDKLLKGKKWAILAIVFGFLGLIFGVFLFFHFITLLQIVPPAPA